MMHYDTLNWVLRALEDGRITKDEFDVLLFCAARMDWKRYEVRAYSSAQVCRFYGQDATDGNRKKYQRAKESLIRLGVLRDDYQAGKERPYSVFVPKKDPWGDPSRPYEAAPGNRDESLSLCQGLSQLPVPAFVAAPDSLNASESEACKPNSESVSQLLSQQKSIGLSATNQYATCEREKDPLNPPAGDLTTPRPPVGGGAQTPLGFSPPTPRPPLGGEPHSEGEGTVQDRPARVLDEKQSQRLAQIVEEFCALWMQHGGFVPDRTDTRRLLREHSPLEVLAAYLSISGKPSNAVKARFFATGAPVLIAQRRREGISCEVPIGRVVESEDQARILKFYALEKRWRELFGLEVPPLRSNVEKSQGVFHRMVYVEAERRWRLKEQPIKPVPAVAAPVAVPVAVAETKG